ncbi:MAG: glycoside hydrolase family 3 protein [Planctomycetes bacterium]|nr:glycoside hydrolase family 3 protein [Planctomycetota bacterium]MCB9918335.1 glycoside hydrolase family 3 protein [Planctomycetota bacterium]
MTTTPGGGSRLMLGFEGYSVGSAFHDLLAETGARCVILFARNITCAEQCKDLILELRASVPWPLLVAVDQEGGAVVRLTRGATVFPGNMALGAAAEPQLALEVGRASGRELAAIGFDLNLAPVVDLQTNPLNPGIGIRSFGADRSLATDLAEAFVRGHAESGVSCCLKHFPGKGAASVDAHLDLPVLELELSEFREPHVRIFEDAFARLEDCDPCVMTTHVLVRGLDPDLPATLSRRVVNDFLRAELAFDGLVIADDLEMGAIEKHGSVAEAALGAAVAGHDVLPVCHRPDRQREAARLLDAAVTDGRLDAESHARACARIARHSARGVSTSPSSTTSSGPLGLDLDAGAHIARMVAERAFTVLADPGGLLPIGANDRVLLLAARPHAVVGVEEVADRDWSGLVFGAFESAGARSPVVRDFDLGTLGRQPHATRERLLEGASDFTRVVLLSWNASFSEPMRGLLEAVCAAVPERLVVVHLRNPFDQALVPATVTAVTNYGYRVAHIEALAKGLLGAFHARGRMPAPIRPVPN